MHFYRDDLELLLHVFGGLRPFKFNFIQIQTFKFQVLLEIT